MSSIISERENGFREVLSFADLEVEYNGNIENNDQTLPHGVVVLAERLAHCLMLFVYVCVCENTLRACKT
ncbi:hypothetical protein T12_2683 [Trichinella patagoniensis]|uniref:Uncharacterized protein n=1 Tax=Trichinella patagoniensis TaxID=990121 RepID=A0A0V0Z579_9BILA|nr:hypothetical protein T12_2683 [Trichinella patagoniensis]